MKTVESGVPAVFPLVQNIAGYEYLPESGTITVRNRAGNIVHECELEEGAQSITLPAVETETVDYRWVRMTFVSGGEVKSSKWTYRIIPFLGTTITNDEVRVRLGATPEMLPDSMIALIDQYLKHQKKFPTIPAGDELDKLVVLAECLRLAKISTQWMLKSRKVDDLSETRYDHDLSGLIAELSEEYNNLLVEMVPEVETTFSPPQLLQFVTMTDVVTGA